MMEELKELAQKRDEAAVELLQCLREYAAIAENQRDIWRNQQSGAADWRG